MVLCGSGFLFGFDKQGWSCNILTAIQSGISCSPLTGVICMAFSVVSTVIVSLFTKAPEEQVIVNAFNIKN
jgi:hypothetical protein